MSQQVETATLKAALQASFSNVEETLPVNLERLLAQLSKRRSEEEAGKAGTTAD